MPFPFPAETINASTGLPAVVKNLWVVQVSRRVALGFEPCTVDLKPGCQAKVTCCVHTARQGGIRFEDMETKLGNDLNAFNQASAHLPLNSPGAIYHAIWNAAFEVCPLSLCACVCLFRCVFRCVRACACMRLTVCMCILVSASAASHRQGMHGVGCACVRACRHIHS